MNVLENQAVGLHFQKMQHLKFLHQHTCSFTGYATSFFFIPSWRPAYGSKFSSNIIHSVYMLAEELALHFLNKQVHNFSWSMLSINEVEYCLHAMELYYLIATTPETRGLPHQFEFDPGISFLKECCYLSDYKCNYDISTSDGSLPLVEPNFFSVNNFDPPKIVASLLSFYTVLDLPTSEDSHLQKAPPRLLVNGYMVSKEKRIHMKKPTYVSQITEASVFHVSLLKRKVGTRVVVQPTLPSTDYDGHFLVQPVANLMRQMVNKKNVVGVQVLVQWSNLPPEDATWEDYPYLRAKILQFC